MPPVDLEGRLGDPEAGIAAPNLGHRGSDRGVRVAGADRPRGVVGGGTHPLDVDKHVRTAMLDCLEGADRLPELFPLTGVVHRNVHDRPGGTQ